MIGTKEFRSRFYDGVLLDMNDEFWFWYNFWLAQKAIWELQK